MGPGSLPGLRTEGVLAGGLEPRRDTTPLGFVTGVAHGSTWDVPAWTWTVMEVLSHGYRRPRDATAALNDPWVADLLLTAYLGATRVAEPKAESPSFFALAEQLMQTASATVDQIARLSGATRRTYYNWRKDDRAPEDARRRIVRAGRWLERAIDEVPNLALRGEIDPSTEGSLGYLLAGGASDAALLQRLSQLTTPADPITVRVVDRLDRADAFDEDELLDPGELIAMAAAAPRPRRRLAATVAFEPAELTDSLHDDLG